MKMSMWIGAAAVAAGVVAVAPLDAGAVPTLPDEQLCDSEFQPAECGPANGGIDYSPPVYDAIGRDRDLDDAFDEAEDEAADRCPGGSFDVVRLRTNLQTNGVWKVTLNHTC